MHGSSVRGRDQGRSARAAVGAALATIAIGLSCGGGGGGVGADATLRGHAWYGGPLAGAKVQAWQLVDGQRTAMLAEATTDDAGAFTLAVDGYEHLALDAIGGHYTELAGGAVTLPADHVLHGVALDVGTGEVRDDVAITPLTDVLVGLAYSRAAAGERWNEAAPLVRARLAAHLDFDPTHAAIGDLTRPLAANDDASQHALVLAGLSDQAATAAADLRVTAQDVNVAAFVRVLRDDAGSTEARLDGNRTGDASPLHVGATCPADAPGARASCRITSNTLRARLAEGVLRHLVSERNHTGLARADVLAWVTALATNTDPALFGGDPPEAIDRVGPTITWVKPAADAQLAGATPIEVTATDELGVDRLEVAVFAADADANDPPLATVADTDPAPGRFAGNLDTIPLPEGAVVLRAVAHDLDDNATTTTRAATVNNVVGGTVSGVVVKGRVEGAMVKVYRYAGGLRGALLGQGTTAADGSFTNLALADGYAGPLLVEAGFGGHYPEEAGPATVTLDVADALRTIVPSYADGASPSGLVISPLTSFAVTYRERVLAAGAGTVPEQWQAATAAIEAHFGVANIRTVAPLAPEDMLTLTAGARYGLVLVGLSELARQASTLGGGDAGSFGLASSSLRVWRRWEEDLADGCWDGKAGTVELSYGGTQRLGPDPTRRALASAIAGYVASPRNATPFAGIVDVLPLLDAVATGGGASALGACGPASPGTLWPPTDAVSFDQERPTIAISPVEGAVVRGAVLVSALATDNLDTRPTLLVTAPPALAGADLDGDPTDSDARVTVDTMALVGPEGPFAITFESVDDATNTRVETRHLVVDNVPPAIAIAGVVDGASYAPPRVIDVTVTDPHLAASTVRLDGNPFSSGAAVVAPGLHTLTVTASDTAGNQSSATRGFRIDASLPTISVSGFTNHGFHQPPVAVGFAATDDDLDSVTATLDGNPLPAPGGPVSAEGHHDLVVTARDHAGHEVTEPFDFTVDSLLPTITIVGVTDGGVHAPPRSVTFSADDANLESVSATLDGSPYVSGVAIAAVGHHVLRVTARDKAGHQVLETRAFDLDAAGPTLSIAGVLPDGFHQPPVTITFGALDPHLVPGDPTATLTGPGWPALPFLSGTSLATEGDFDLLVSAADTAGNTSTLPRHFVLDGTRPTVAIDGVDDHGVHAPPRTITFDAVDAHLLSVSATLDGQPFASGVAVAAVGDHVLTVVARDRAGNETTTTRSFALDDTGPLLSIAGVLDGGFHQPPVTITFSAMDPHLAGPATATLDGLPILSGTVAATEGQHVLLVTASDAAGHTSTQTRTFTLDGTRPVIEIAPDLQDGGFYPRQQAVAFTATDVNLQSSAATLDGQPFASGNAILADGLHTLVVSAVDRAGNAASTTRTFTIDGVVPTVAFGVVTDSGFYKPGVRPTFAAVDTNLQAATATISVAGGPPQPFASGDAVAGPDGLRTIAVHAVDRAGNITDATVTFTIDGTDPLLAVDPDLLTGGFYRRQQAVAFTATDVNLQSSSATLDGQPFASGASILADGPHTLVVSATDKAGNAASTTRTFTIDGVAPTVTFGVVAADGFYKPGVRPTCAAVDTNLQAATATISVAGGPPQPFASGDAVGGPDGLRTIAVHAVDKAGNATDASISFTIDGTAPVLAVDPDLLTGGFYQRQQAVSFTATDINLQSSTATLDGQPFASGASILADGQHTLVVSATDKAGNAASTTRTFTIDGVAPAVTFGVVAADGFYKPGVRPTFAVVDTNLQAATATISVAGGPPQPFASGDAVGGPDGLRTIAVHAVDKAGNATDASVTFTLDGTAPVVAIDPDLLTGGFYQRQQAVTFTATDINLQSSTATLDDQPFASGASILVDGQHTLVVSATDRAGNAASTSRTFTIDGVAPAVTFGVVAPGGFYKPGVRPTITVDEPHPLSAVATISVAGGPPQPFTSGDAVGGPDGLRTITVHAVDQAGNATDASISFTIDGTAPVITLDPNLEDGHFYKPLAAVTFTGTDANLLSTTAVLGAQPFNSGNAIQGQGQQTLAVTAVDKAGNATELTRTFTIDGVAPTVTFDVVAANGFYKPGVRPTLAAADDNLQSATSTISVAGGPPQPFASGDAVGGADGLRTIAVHAVDRAGNVTDASISFTIDGTRPAVTVQNVIEGGVYKSPRQIHYLATDDHLLLPVTAILTNGSGQPRAFADNAALLAADAGDCTLVVHAIDAAGNTTDLPVHFAVDDAPPVITLAGVADGAFVDVASITFTVGQQDGHPGATTATLDGVAIANTHTVFDEATYHLVVHAVDAAGNAIDRNFAFTIDRTAPAITTNPVLAQNQFYQPIAALSYQINEANLLSSTATLDGPPFASGAAVLEPGQHRLVINVMDKAGHPAALDRTFTIDGTAPVITFGAVAPGGFYKPGVHPTFASDEPLQSQSATISFAGGPPQPFASGDLVGGVDGQRTIAVHAVDRAGNATDASISFTIDGTPPVITVDEPVSSGAYHSPKQLKFSAADAGGLDGPATGSLTNGSGQVRVVSNNDLATAADAGQCNLVVTARDRAGNIATTPPRTFFIDDTAPVITIGGVAEGGYYREVTPTVQVTDLTLDMSLVTLDNVPYVLGTPIAAGEGLRTLRVFATDRTGLSSEQLVHFTIDRTPPTVTLDQTGLTDFGGYLWTTAASPTLPVAVADANPLSVRAVKNAITLDQDLAAPWTLTIPANTISTAAPGTVISIIATDRAGNSTTLDRTFRYDGAAPVVVMLPTKAFDESKDTLEGVADIGNPLAIGLVVTHRHTEEVQLGAPSACDATAPTVSKYAYLLDEQLPPYVTEAWSNPNEPPHRPLQWRFSAVDDGIGLVSVQWRLVNADSGAVVQDWTAAPIDGPDSFLVSMFRKATAGAIPALGAKGRFRIEVRATDRSGRISAIDRCWNHAPLPPPLFAPQDAGAALSGQPGSGKYGLIGLKLDDAAAPIDPIAAYVLNGGGAGLMEFPVWNASTEPVYLTIDLDKPPASTYSRTSIRDQWTLKSTVTAIDCGPSTLPLPDTDLAGCAGGLNPVDSDGVLESDSGGSTATFAVRVWEEQSVGTFSALTAANCPECDQTAPNASTLRLTLKLPGRTPPNLVGDPSPARKFVVMPIVERIPELSPLDLATPAADDRSTFSDITLNGRFLTGRVRASVSFCSAHAKVGNRWQCTRTATYSKYDALTAASFELTTVPRALVATSLNGSSPVRPPSLTAAKATKSSPFDPWTSAEGTLPPLP